MQIEVERTTDKVSGLTYYIIMHIYINQPRRQQAKEMIELFYSPGPGNKKSYTSSLYKLYLTQVNKVGLRIIDEHELLPLRSKYQ